MLLEDDPGIDIQLGLAESTRQDRKRLGGYSQIGQELGVPTQFFLRIANCPGKWLRLIGRERPRHVGQALGESVPVLALRVTPPVLEDRLSGERVELLIGEVTAGVSDDSVVGRQKVRELEVVQGG